MLVTHAGQERLRARPMAIAEVEADLCVWFITSVESAKVHEIESDTRVHLICQKDRSAYLSIEGLADLVNDRNRISEVWSEEFKVWFPGGKSDPDIVLIKVRPQRSEYWDNQGANKVAYLWEAARAYVTGTTPEIKEGEPHGVVQS